MSRRSVSPWNFPVSGRSRQDAEVAGDGGWPAHHRPAASGAHDDDAQQPLAHALLDRGDGVLIEAAGCPKHDTAHRRRLEHTVGKYNSGSAGGGLTLLLAEGFPNDCAAAVRIFFGTRSGVGLQHIPCLPRVDRRQGIHRLGSE